MLTTKIRKIGNANVVTVPSDVLRMLGLVPGDRIAWEVVGKKLIATPIKEDKAEAK